jgi:ABC-type lipoprotein release transport system permease subunit
VIGAESFVDRYWPRCDNPATYALAAGGLLAVAIASSLVPAARAMRLDPLAVLRHE